MKTMNNQAGHLQCFEAAHKFNFETLSSALYITCFNAIRSELAKSIDEMELKIEMEKGLPNEIYFPAGSHLEIQKTVAKIITQAVQALYICDGFMDEKIIEELTNVSASSIKLLTDKPKPLFLQRLKAAQLQFSTIKQIEARTTNDIHDRLFIIDEDQVWMFGTSYNKAGSKPTSISKIETSKEKQKAIDEFNTIWAKASVVS